MELNSKRTHGWLAVAIVAAALVGVGGAQTAPIPQLLTLGPLTVLNGTAVASGTLGGAGLGGQVELNGQPLAVDAAGNFAGTVALDGASALDFGLTTANGQHVDFTIPLALAGPGGVIDGSVIDAVEQAGAQLLEPAGGFQAVAGQPLKVGGSVADQGQLASLGVNGIDAKSLLGADHTFSLKVPGTTKEITLKATDTHGVTETTRYQVLSSQSFLATPYGTSVAAQSAQGLRIAKIQYSAVRVAATKRVRMLVVLKDRRGYLVRGAKITVRSKAPGVLRKRAQAKRSSTAGRATFVLNVKPRVLGKRLVMVTVARTSSLKAAKTTSVRLRKARHR